MGLDLRPIVAHNTNAQAGLYGPTARGWYQAPTVVTNTLRRFHRVVPAQDMVIVALGHVVSVVAAADDTVDFGLYTAAGLPIVTTGLVAGKCNALGPQSQAIAATTIRAGVAYYYGHKYGSILGANAATVHFANFGSVQGPKIFGATAGKFKAWDVSAIAADTLPASMSFAANSTALVPAGLLLTA